MRLKKKAIEVVCPLTSAHTTILHVPGLDDNKLTNFHAGSSNN